MKYLVKMKEIWIQDVYIEADNPDDARDLVADGQGNFVGIEEGAKIPEREGFEFVETTDRDEWKVIKLP